MEKIGHMIATFINWNLFTSKRGEDQKTGKACQERL